MLYGLLTGRHPFEIEDSSPLEAWETIVKETPPAPSTVATPEAAVAMGFGTVSRLSRALKGELDAIVLMALRKEPARRYGSAEAIGEDVQRYLRGLPVQARPDSAGYRLRKLVGRNRMVTAVSALAVVAMVGGTVISLTQASKARAESQGGPGESYREAGIGLSRRHLRLSRSLVDRAWSWAGRLARGCSGRGRRTNRHGAWGRA